MGESDPDVVRWGLHFLDVDQMCNPNDHGGGNQHEVNIAREQSIRGCSYDTEYRNVENDDSSAQSLQEELSQLHTGEEHLQASTFGLVWHSPSATSFYSGHEGGEHEANDLVVSSSCSSPEDKSYDGDEYSYTLEIGDESALDGEVGKWLNQMASVPHVPKINGDIPTIDEATSDHQRLLNRLQLYDLVEEKIQGDGNCQFRALSDQIYRSPEHHKAVRKQVVNQLKSHPEMYEGYVPMAYGDYLKKMSKSGEWGDHVTLQAAADSYGVKIFVITSFKDTCYIEILPEVQKSTRVILLSFWAEVHYNSIYPEGDNFHQGGDSKRKKRWWMLGSKH